MFKIEDGTFRRPDRVVVKEHFVTHESSEEDIARLILRLKELLNGRSSKIAFEMMEEGVRQVLKEKKAWFLYNHKEGSYVHIYWLFKNVGVSRFPKYDIIALGNAEYMLSGDNVSLSFWFPHEDEKILYLFKGQTCHINGGSPCYGDTVHNIMAASISLPDSYTAIEDYLNGFNSASQFRSSSTNGARIAWMMGLGLSESNYSRSFHYIEKLHEKLTPTEIRHKLESLILKHGIGDQGKREFILDHINNYLVWRFIATGHSQAREEIPQSLYAIIDSLYHSRYGRLDEDSKSHLVSYTRLLRDYTSTSSHTVGFFRRIEATRSIEEVLKFVKQLEKSKTTSISKIDKEAYLQSFELAEKALQKVFNMTMTTYANKLTSIANGITKLEEMTNDSISNSNQSVG